MITEDMSKYAEELAQNDACLVEHERQYPSSYISRMWPVYQRMVIDNFYKDIYFSVDDALARLEVQQHKCTKCHKQFVYDTLADRRPILSRRNKSEEFSYDNIIFRCGECAKPECKQMQTEAEWNEFYFKE